jgi:glycerol kinase
MSDLVLALDQGTSSSRALLFDQGGACVGMAQEPLRASYPHPGWVEQDPEEIWQTQLAAGQAVLREAGVGPGDVAAIGIANQRETTLLWDRAGRPVANAIVWQDRRTTAACDALRARGLEPLFRERTGLLLDPYFSGT